MIRTLVITSIIVSILAAVILIPLFPHDRQLAKLEASYALVAHLPSSKKMAEFSEVGLLGGANGNHCDFLVGEIRQSDASEEEIRRHYSSQQVTSPSEAAYSLAPVLEFPEHRTQHSGILQYEIKHLVSKARVDRSLATLYVVYYLDEGHEPGIDFRCY